MLVDKSMHVSLCGKHLCFYIKTQISPDRPKRKFGSTAANLCNSYHNPYNYVCIMRGKENNFKVLMMSSQDILTTECQRFEIHFNSETPQLHCSCGVSELKYTNRQVPQ